MTKGTSAMSVLVAEIDSHVERIEREKTCAACPSHPSIADGMVLLLRLRKAEYEDRRADQREARSALVTAGLALAVAVLQGLGVVMWGALK